MSDMRSLIEKLTAISEDRPSIGDGVFLEFGNILQVDTEIMEMSGDSITLLGDEKLFAVLESLNEIESRSVHKIAEGEVVSLQDNHQTLKRLAKMWWHGDEGKHAQAVKMLSNMGWDIAEDDDDVVLNKGNKEIRFFMDDLYESIVAEAEYHGRKVPLGKPMRGDVKKFKVFVKDPKTGNVKKVNFGDKKMRIKKSNPKRRKSFRARHHCANPGPRTKARYWSCRKW
jgi:hypothetical protein